jgi:hypothetical protein
LVKVVVMKDEILINANGLKWLPWVGNNYESNDNKILIVGESHYHDETKESSEKHQDLKFTRKVIEELAIDRYYYGTRIFPNLHKALFRNDEFDSNKFWNLVAFYNFVQRPMNTNKSRPDYKDFYNGWNTFFSLAEILRPQTCIFVGTSAANSLMDSIQESEYSCNGVKWEDFISNAYAKTATIEKNGNQIRLIFIRHTSSMFSWDKWNKYLSKTIPEELAALEEKL